MRYRLFTTQDTTVMGNSTDGVAVTGANTYYSSKLTGDMGSYISLMLQWTGNPTGTLTLWSTNKTTPDETTDNDWVQDTTFSPTNPAGSAGKFMDFVGNSAAKFWRIKYVNSGGSGTLFCYATAGRYR